MSAKRPTEGAVDPLRPPGLRITQVFLSHANFRYKADPLTLSAPEPGATVQLDVQVQVIELEQPSGAPVAGVRVRVRTNEENNHPYIFDVSMGAVIDVEPGQENYNPRDYVTNTGAALLYPFVREAIANITQRGRFGAIWIPPFNMRLALSEEADSEL